MSLKISYFLPKPLFFKDTKIPPVAISDIIDIDINEERGVTLVKFRVKSQNSNSVYELNIELQSIKEIANQTEVKVSCSCDSFKYKYKSLLNIYESLYGPVDTEKLPKKQTKPYICKHLYGAILLLLKFNNVENLKNIKTIEREHGKSKPSNKDSVRT